MATCGPLLPPAVRWWGPLRRQGLRSHLAHLWATSYSAPPATKRRGPLRGTGYVATLPTCGPHRIRPRALKRWGPPGGRGHVAPLPTCGPTLILPRAVKRWGPPRPQGLWSHLAHLWANSDCAPRSEAWYPQGGRVCVATLPTCGPPLMLPPALKHWQPPRRQGSCSDFAHSWATYDSAPRSESVGTPRGGKGYLATLRTCGPLLILPPALKQW